MNCDVEGFMLCELWCGGVQTVNCGVEGFRL